MFQGCVGALANSKLTSMLDNTNSYLRTTLYLLYDPLPRACLLAHTHLLSISFDYNMYILPVCIVVEESVSRLSI